MVSYQLVAIFFISGKLHQREGNAVIAVTSISGTVLYNENVDVKKGYFSKTIQLNSALPVGIYFVKVVSGSGTKTTKIVKNR